MTIGLSDGSFVYDRNENIIHHLKGYSNSTLIPKERFLTEIQNLDYALFFTGNNDEYDLIPSGVFSDCIAFEIPIISLENEKMNFFFEQYGHIGYLCNDIENMAKVIKSITPKDKIQFTNNIRQIKKELSSTNYTLNLGKIIFPRA